MFEPTLALQSAIRARLINWPDVTALVPADHIRAGATRPDKTPCILMSDGNAVLRGDDYKHQSAAWVFLDLHIWTMNTGQDEAKNIAGTVNAALSKTVLADEVQGGFIDHFGVASIRHILDPNPDYGHSVLSVEACMRWLA